MTHGISSTGGSATNWLRLCDRRLVDAGDYAGRAVAIAGANGFIGRSCADALTALGARVTVLNRRRDPAAAARGLREIVGALANPSKLRSALEGQSIVFDLIGTVAAVDSNRDPERSLREDCAPHLALLGACADLPQRPIVVFPSSRLVYGRPLRTPVDEDHPLQPQSMYAVHKITVENYLRVFATTRSLPHVILRISNPYGPGAVGGGGSHGILNHFARLAAERRPITLFGDGSQQRDYVFIADLVSMMLRSAVTPACVDRTFNVGGAEPVSLASAARLIADAAGASVKHVPWPDDARQVETGDYSSDTSRLASCLGSLPATPFDLGVSEMLRYYRRLVAERSSAVGNVA